MISSESSEVYIYIPRVPDDYSKTSLGILLYYTI